MVITNIETVLIVPIMVFPFKGEEMLLNSDFLFLIQSLFSKNFQLNFPEVYEDFSSVSFWYQNNSNQANPHLQAPNERAKFFRKHKIPGALEGELLAMHKIASPRYHSIIPVNMSDYEDGDWSGESQIYLKYKSTSWFSMKVPVKKRGKL